ncbi:MAG: 16S rRNA (cytosine(967)-C(5))-methyltransferase RsmB [Promethearchaeota archaeon]
MSKTSKTEISREEASAEVLCIWEEQTQSLRAAMNQLAKDWQISDWKIRTAIHSLVFETVRRLNTLDFLLNKVLEKSQIIDLDPIIRNTLRVATYLIHFTETPPALATNEAVTIIKRRKNRRLAGLANAVLRKVQRIDRESINKCFQEQGFPELKYSVPRWLFDYINQLFEPDEAQAFLSAILQNPSVNIRVNTLKQPVEETIKRLEMAEFLCTPIPKLSEAFRIQRGEKPVSQTEVYEQSAIYLQSLASILVSRILNPNPREIVVDLCAAPGSKTSHLAQIMNNTGNILAIDNMSNRVQKLKRNLLRLGVQNTHVIFANSFNLPFRKSFQADAVLVDPPCSNTGVIQTRPETKWIMTPDKVRHLSGIQSNLLEEGSRLVAPDGHVVYSTCSITLDENEHLIRDFLDIHPWFELVPTEPHLGSDAFEGLTACQRLFPHQHNTEGFFIAKMKRTETVHGDRL